jgi:hypothetical protein
MREKNYEEKRINGELLGFKEKSEIYFEATEKEKECFKGNTLVTVKLETTCNESK